MLTIQLDILICSINQLRNIHLDALVHYTGSTVQLERLRKDEPGWPSTEEESLDPDRGVELVQPVDCACGRFEQRRFFVCSKFVDLVELLLLAQKTVNSAIPRNTKSDTAY